MKKYRLFTVIKSNLKHSLTRSSMGRGYDINARDCRFESHCVLFLAIGVYFDANFLVSHLNELTSIDFVFYVIELQKHCGVTWTEELHCI